MDEEALSTEDKGTTTAVTVLALHQPSPLVLSPAPSSLGRWVERHIFLGGGRSTFLSWEGGRGVHGVFVSFVGAGTGGGGGLFSA